MNTETIVQSLKEEKERLEKAIAALEGSWEKSTNRRRTAGHAAGNGRRRRKRKLSPAARKRISQAAKARWAKAKKAGRNTL